jgi:ubiquinone/menaquinone biosynthesis C-methylase UbiE
VSDLVEALKPAESKGFAGFLLAVGCGFDDLQTWKDSGYGCVRLDIDPGSNPDIVGTMVDLGMIRDEMYSVVYCSHSLEHLYPHDVPRALAEFYRVLKKGGKLVILVPDLQDVAATDEKLEGSDLCGLHLYYGDAAQIEAHPYMAHHSGFVESTLRRAMESAGFTVETQRMSFYNLMGIGIK